MLQFEVGTDVNNNFTIILFITYVLELSLKSFFFILTFLNLFACDYYLITLNF